MQYHASELCNITANIFGKSCLFYEDILVYNLNGIENIWVDSVL